LSAPRTGRLFLPGDTPGTNFCWRLGRPQGHSAVGRNKSKKNVSNNTGNGTREPMIPQTVIFNGELSRPYYKADGIIGHY